MDEEEVKRIMTELDKEQGVPSDEEACERLLEAIRTARKTEFTEKFQNAADEIRRLSEKYFGPGTVVLTDRGSATVYKPVYGIIFPQGEAPCKGLEP